MDFQTLKLTYDALPPAAKAVCAKAGAAVLDKVRGVEVLVLDALRRKPHPTHLCLDEALTTARRVGAGRTYFTHLTHGMSHRDLEALLPAQIRPAHDGLRLEFSQWD